MKMNRTYFQSAVAVLVLFSSSAIALSQPATPDAATLRTNAAVFFSPIPDKIPGADKDSAELVSLGKQLYFEKRLSKNNSQSCNTCHAVDGGRAGVDNQPTSIGAFGKRGQRNSPTTWNAAFHIAQFWDGRAENLEAQAKGPILNPVEMAMSSEPEVLERLKADANYPKQFKAAFVGQTDPINYDNVAKAIAAFERTLVTHDRFDDFLKGQNDALTAAELKGLNTFMKTGCTTCHNGPLIGGNSYRKIGIVKAYPNQTDLGRASITKDDNDRFVFKVPSLRNIAATYPYFHDGNAASLHEAVRTMADIQLATQLTPEQETDLVTFLKALTGKLLHVGPDAAP